MTAQEVFDKVKKHLLTQMERSITLDRCAYRGIGGLKCAVGCLIPDELYDPKFEGLSVWEDMTSITIRERDLLNVLVTLGLGEQLALLHDLQFVHDYYPSDQWSHQLGQVASKYGLTYEQDISKQE